VRFLASVPGQSIIQKHTLSIPSLRSLSIEEDSVPHRPKRYGLYREIMFSFRSHMDLHLARSDFLDVFRQMKLYFANMMDEEELCKEISNVLSGKK